MKLIIHLVALLAISHVSLGCASESKEPTLKAESRNDSLPRYLQSGARPEFVLQMDEVVQPEGDPLDPSQIKLVIEAIESKSPGQISVRFNLVSPVPICVDSKIASQLMFSGGPLEPPIALPAQQWQGVLTLNPSADSR